MDETKIKQITKRFDPLWVITLIISLGCMMWAITHIDNYVDQCEQQCNEFIQTEFRNCLIQNEITMPQPFNISKADIDQIRKKDALSEVKKNGKQI
jgi:hypothetical protein